jgi:predicted methyltransferase
MTERELLEKIREIKKALEDLDSGKIEKSALSWRTEILNESQEVFRKSHTMQSGGSKCHHCGGTGIGIG